MSKRRQRIPKPSKEEIFDLYWNQKLTAKAIATKCNVSQSTILKWLKFYNISRRAPANKQRIQRPQKNNLYSLYWNQKLTTRAIATKYKVSQETVLKWLKFYNIPRRAPANEQRIEYPSKKKLKNLYWNQKLSLQHIADLFHVCDGTVLKWMKDYEIPRRSSRNKVIYPPPAEELKNLYWNQELSLQKIANRYNVSKATVQKWFKDYNIQKRKSCNQAINRPPKEELENLYCRQSLNLQQIAMMYEVSESTVTNWFKFYEILRRKPANEISIPQPKKKKLIDLYWRQNLTLLQISTKYKASQGTVFKWFKEYSIKTRPTTPNGFWREWQSLCSQQIRKILLPNKDWKLEPVIYTPQFPQKEYVKPDLVLYDKGRIDEIIDFKWSDYHLDFKDRIVHPALTRKKRAYFWLLQGQSRIEFYFNNGYEFTIPYIDQYYEFENKDIERVLLFINSDDIIQNLRKHITETNKSYVNETISQIYQLQRQKSIKDYISLYRFLNYLDY